MRVGVAWKIWESGDSMADLSGVMMRDLGESGVVAWQFWVSRGSMADLGEQG